MTHNILYKEIVTELENENASQSEHWPKENK